MRGRLWGVLVLVLASAALGYGWRGKGQPAKALGERAHHLPQVRNTHRPLQHLVSVPLSLCTWALLQSNWFPALAAIPSMDEYNGGAGAVTRTQNFLNPAPSSNPPKTNEMNEKGDDVVSVYDLLSCEDALFKVRDLVNKQAWDDVRTSLNKRPIAFISKPYYGRANVRALSDALKVPTTKAESLEKMRQDIAYQLNQLSDFALSNRVLFFNSEDLDQVMKLRESTGVPNVDLKEPLGFVYDAEEQLQLLLMSL